MNKRFFVSILVVILYCFNFSVLKAQSISINEISICNISNELDPNYDYNGWIEIYNTTNSNVNLNSLYYSDEPGKATKYKLSASRILPANGFATIWINDEVTDGNGLYFDSDADGGYLSIADANGAILDEINYPIQHTNVSWGRTTDGGSSFGYFIKSTHNHSNNGSATASTVVAEPTFSQKGGFFSASISVSIQCKTEDAQIFYTLDGSYPTPKKNLYTGTPIQIDSSTPLRAKAFANGYLEGTIATATYMINERVPDLPVFFITTDTINLYDDSLGIYCIGTNGIVGNIGSTPANWHQNWTRPAHIEFLDSTNDLQFSQACGLSIAGNFTRNYNQKSFNINAGKKYGNNRFDYQLFPNKDGRRYKSFLLHNGGQHYSSGAFKDWFLQSHASAIGLDYQSAQNSVVYMNGKYWGMLSLRERHNKDYVYSNYGLNETDIDIIDIYSKAYVINGNFIAFNRMKDYILNEDLKNDSIYEKAKGLMNMDSFLKYLALEIYVGNTDWPYNNQKLFCKQSDGKFRWILHDLDYSFSKDSINVINNLLLSKSSSFTLKFILNLLKNNDFKNKYIDLECLVAGSVFNVSKFDQKLDSISTLLNREWDYNAERWGYSKNALTSNINSFKRRNKIFNVCAYLNLRTNFALGEPLKLNITTNEESARILFNSLEIPEYPYDGMYFKDKGLTLTAPEFVSGKKFQYWFITKDGITTEEHNLSFTLSLNDSTTTIKAVYDLSDSVRRGGLYINEVSASNAIFVDNLYKYEDWIEIYNASDSSINLAGYYLSNDSKDLELFQFKNTDSLATNIPASGYSIIWCSKELQRGVMHTRLKLAKEGGSLFLSKKDEMGIVKIVDSLTYVPHSDYSSFGRYPDGDVGMYLFEKPTFKATNIATTYNTLIYNQNYDLIYGLEGITPPTLSNMVINNGEPKTADSIVSITFQANKSAVFYRISESPDFVDASWKTIEPEITFKLSPELGKKTIYMQLRNALYQSDVISDDIDFFKKYFKLVVGFSGVSIKNVTEIVNEEVLNYTALSFKDSYSSLNLYDVWGNPTMRLAKKISEISNVMSKYGISKGVSNYSTANNPSFTGNLGVYPDRYYSRAYFFSADSALSIESRRLIAGFINVPNGTYDIRILASQRKETLISDYQSYRYQVNNSEIYIPTSDIFYNNQKNFIEFKNITVEDSTLLICSWREPFGDKSGYYAPMNLIEISEAGTITSDPLIAEKHPMIIYSGKGKVIVENEELQPFTVYSIDGMIVKKVVPENLITEIYLSPGVYIIMGKKAIAF